MDIKVVSPYLSVSSQITVNDIQSIAQQGYKVIINNRPDKESDDQAMSADLAESAKSYDIDFHDVPVIAGQLTADSAKQFAKILCQAKGPVLAFCRTGTRSINLWALGAAVHLSVPLILETGHAAGYNLENLVPKFEQGSQHTRESLEGTSNNIIAQRFSSAFDIVIVGGGSAGIAVAASLLARQGKNLSIAIIEPREIHYYQPGFTMVGGGAFKSSDVVSATSQLIPEKVTWLRIAATAFKPESNSVILEDGSAVTYSYLVVAPGLKLDWDAVEGLRKTLGKNGVTSNYHPALPEYTWELVQTIKNGRAIFTQPPMPIKCAGAPQKAMYMSADYWFRTGVLNDIEVNFNTAGEVLFGVKEFVPALMEYVEKYDAQLNFTHNLVAVDGAAHMAFFDVSDEQGNTVRKEVDFDLLHVCPPQTAPDFIRSSPLANSDGWVDVSQETLQHTRFENIFSLGDACSAPNAKTMAAARQQSPVVAKNLLAVWNGQEPKAIYNGYGACPLTVERGKIVLAEFGYGGKLLPTLPTWLIDGTKPSRLAWILKERFMPVIYYRLMLKGKEWLT